MVLEQLINCGGTLIDDTYGVTLWLNVGVGADFRLIKIWNPVEKIRSRSELGSLNYKIFGSAQISYFPTSQISGSDRISAVLRKLWILSELGVQNFVKFRIRSDLRYFFPKNSSRIGFDFIQSPVQNAYLSDFGWSMHQNSYLCGMEDSFYFLTLLKIIYKTMKTGYFLCISML